MERRVWVLSLQRLLAPRLVLLIRFLLSVDRMIMVQSRLDLDWNIFFYLLRSILEVNGSNGFDEGSFALSTLCYQKIGTVCQLCIF